MSAKGDKLTTDASVLFAKIISCSYERQIPQLKTKTRFLLARRATREQLSRKSSQLHCMIQGANFRRYDTKVVEGLGF